MKRTVIRTALLLVLSLVACSAEPSESDIQAGVQTAIAQTEAARPADTATPQPTDTPLPPTPIPTLIPTATPSCVDLVDVYLAKLDSIFTEWDDANAVANNTARINLSQPTSNLQAIRRQVDDIQPPECAAYPHELITQYMDHVIETYLNFMGERDHLAGVYTEVSKLQFGYFWQAIEQVDQPRSATLVPVDYVVDSSYPGVRYRDETGERVGDRPGMPWTYHFDAEPGALITVTNDLGGACAILINGLIDTIYVSTGSGAATCTGSWYD